MAKCSELKEDGREEHRFHKGDWTKYIFEGVSRTMHMKAHRPKRGRRMGWNMDRRAEREEPLGGGWTEK